MKKSKLTTKQIVLTGMMTAVLAVLSIVTIPLPTGVPVTLQTFAMAFCGYVLGWKLGGASSALYLILGAIGVPVYAGMSGGFGSSRTGRRLYFRIYSDGNALRCRN